MSLCLPVNAGGSPGVHTAFVDVEDQPGMPFSFEAVSVGSFDGSVCVMCSKYRIGQERQTDLETIAAQIMRRFNWQNFHHDFRSIHCLFLLHNPKSAVPGCVYPEKELAASGEG